MSDPLKVYVIDENGRYLCRLGGYGYVCAKCLKVMRPARSVKCPGCRREIRVEYAGKEMEQVSLGKKKDVDEKAGDDKLDP